MTARIDDGRKTWKLSPMDLESYGRWYDYSRARDAMFAATDTEAAPWYVADSNDKRGPASTSSATSSAMVPYKPPPHRDIKLPKRQPRGGYREPDLPRRRIPEPF